MNWQLDRDRAYAVALEGGGAKGAYQIGAWEALQEAGIRICAVSGTSVGALNGAMMVTGELQKAKKIWENIRFSQIMDVDDAAMKALFSGSLRELRRQAGFLKDVLQKRGIDVTPLRQMIEEAADEDAIRAAAAELYIETFSLSDRKELELRARDLQKPGEIRDMLLASAYLPVFRNEALGGKRYADGGLQDVIPIHVLVKNGYRDIIAIRLFGIGLERPVRIPKSVRLHLVLPSRELGGTLEFDAEQSKKNMVTGYYDTMRMLCGLGGSRYYLDCQWSEETCYSVLVRIIRAFREELGEAPSLTELNETLLPRLRKTLGCRGDYRTLLTAVLEQAAEEVDLDPFRIRSEEGMLSELRAYFGREQGRYPAFLGAALLPKPKERSRREPK